MKRVPVRDLWTAAIDVKPRNHEWREGYGETWESYEAVECEKCGKALVLSGGGGCEHREEDHEEEECDGYLSTADGPMMGYYYPLPGFRGGEEEAVKLRDLPLCLVRFLGEEVDEEEEWSLALTGGGMDLSWEICEAFMVLGYLPPTHFCNLPAMADKLYTTRNRWILAGCNRSLTVKAWQVGYRKKSLRHTREALKGYSTRGRE